MASAPEQGFPERFMFRLVESEMRELVTNCDRFEPLDRGNLLPNGILPAESEFDLMRYVSRLIESAKSEIVLIDPYSDAVTQEVLSKKSPGVTVRLVCKDRGKPTPTEVAKFSLAGGLRTLFILNCLGAGRMTMLRYTTTKIRPAILTFAG